MIMLKPSQTNLVNVVEAGEALGVSASTIWRMIRRGELPTVRERGRRLIPSAALELYRSREREVALPPLTAEHPILRLAGAGKSGGGLPGARDKHAILSA